MVVITKYVIINTCESLSKRDKGIYFDKLSYGLEMFSLMVAKALLLADETRMHDPSCSPPGGCKGATSCGSPLSLVQAMNEGAVRTDVDPMVMREVRLRSETPAADTCPGEWQPLRQQRLNDYVADLLDPSFNGRAVPDLGSIHSVSNLATFPIVEINHS
uniref:Predicted protein n=1 Tax=Physcomitrium patens TaxID=3218 RepID=A9U725_PHYPA